MPSPFARLAGSLRAVLTGIALAVCLPPVVAFGDDLDVYAPRFDTDFKPTLLFMIDTSASTRFREGGGGSPWRRDRLLDPMIDFLSTTQGIRVGLSAFNGQQRGGAILHAARDLDQDLCELQDCSSISVRVPVARGSDDGTEDLADGRMSLRSHTGHVVGKIDTLFKRDSYFLESLDQVAVETGTLGFHRPEVLSLFHDDKGDTTRIALRWPQVSVPAGATLENVRLRFEWAGNEHLDPDEGEGSGPISSRIWLDSRADSPVLADAAGQGVGDRPRTTAGVDWTLSRASNWENGDRTFSHTTSNLLPAFEQVRPAGSSGPVTFIIEPDAGFPTDAIHAINLLGVHTRDARHLVPRLDIAYRLGDTPDLEPRISGFRFDGLNVPPGSRITSAHLEIAPANWLDETDEQAHWQVRAENSGDAPRFETTKHNLSARGLIGEQVDWQPASFYRTSEARTRSPDLSSLVQAVVSRGDWCAGNALALQVHGTGGRHLFWRDSANLRAPSLHVTYEPLPAGSFDNCRQQPRHAGLLLASEGDVRETWAGGLAPAGPVFDTDGSGDRRLGLRFPGVDLEAGARIGEAVLSLSTVGAVRWRTVLQVSIDSDTPNAPFDPQEGLAGRLRDEPVIEWSSDLIAEGDRIDSVDLAPLIQRAVDSPGWQRGGDLVLSFKRSRDQQFAFATSDSNEHRGPTLRISERLSGDAADAIPLLSARDVLIEQLQSLPAVGETPLVDAFHESARYLLGESVEHGRQRGEQWSSNTRFRLSNPDTWAGGSIVRSIDCDPQDLDSEHCVDEVIQGADAAYLAPPVGECLANQIVLVTDGEPTSITSDTPASIRSMIGVDSCEQAPDSQTCATDLARWLAAGAHDRAPIKVNTIGFDVESGFLQRVAVAGGGRAFQANSTDELSRSLALISDSAVHQASTFAAPTVAVSRHNRAAHRDEAYLGLFQPDASGTLWPGNLKRYGIGALEDGSIGLLDADGDAAIDPETGSFTATARSYWSITDDGAQVVRGGAASRLSSARKLLTWPQASNGEHSGVRTLVPFHEDEPAITAADLGVQPARRREAIRWARGLDALDEDADGQFDEARAAMGAAIHTTPTVLDYLSADSVDTSVLFAGTQEGLLHAIDTRTGRERFAFLPFELFGHIGAYTGSASTGRRYGLDGPLGTWLSDENRNGAVDPGETALVIAGMRRGGVHYYALDVSDPDAPFIAWTIDPSRDGFAALGQSWSAMQPAYLPADPAAGEGTAPRAVLVFGNGYDSVNDSRDPTLALQDRGAVFMVDPRTGELIQRIDADDDSRLVHSIPADLAVVDLDFDGVTDLLLAADVGGNLWRIDIDSATQASLSHSARLAHRPNVAIDPSSPASADGDRRFFHSPDVALLQGSTGPAALGVTIGSGRRDHPLGKAITDRLHLLLLDPVSAAPLPITELDLFDATDEPAVLQAHHRGWYIDLERPGEKILGTPAVMDGRLLVTSFAPPETLGNACAPNLGTSYLYALDVFSARPALAPDTLDEDPERSIELDIRGIPPPVSIVFDETRPGNPSVFAGTESVDVLEARKSRERVYWVSD